MSTRNGSTLNGRVAVVMDLGHFRQLEVDLDIGSSSKVFVLKWQEIGAGQTIGLAPSRYLALTENGMPQEVEHQRADWSR